VLQVYRLNGLQSTPGLEVVIDHPKGSIGVVLALAPGLEQRDGLQKLLLFGGKPVRQDEADHAINGVHDIINLEGVAGGGSDIFELQIAAAFVFEVDEPE